jgi:23S rRNA (uracil1939-C5)-methyltransferase
MAVVVTSGNDLPKKRALIDALNGVATNIVHNINSERTNTVLGGRSASVWGEPLTEELMGLTFRVSDQSFLQVNHSQCERLYAYVLEQAGLSASDTVTDAYCGVGGIGINLAPYASRIIGIESEASAVADARQNAVMNGLSNFEFVCGRAEFVLPDLKKKGVDIHVAILDPPARGCDKRVLEGLAEAKPHRVVYVSCNPATLARDLKILQELGFVFVEAQPVDMFPQTMSMECVALLMYKIPPL